MVLRVKVARSARKHRVSKHRILTAMRHSGVPTIQPNNSILFVGRDTGGRLTEVIAITAGEDDELLIVIHAMPLEWTR